MHDVIEWVGQQLWCDGNVGMLGISYFAMTQLEKAAVERPPYLKAIFPFGATIDLYDAASHHGLPSTNFLSSFLSVLGLTATRSDRFYRSAPFAVARRILNLPTVHKKFATMNGESSNAILNLLMKLPHPPEPWDELWQDAVVKHPLRDAWWDDRDLTPLLENIDIPVYSGCDWENAPLHLPSTFSALPLLIKSPCVRVAMLRQVRHDLAVGEPAHRSARVVRPLAQGTGHRRPRGSGIPLLPARSRRVEGGGVMATAQQLAP